jgi:A/G-specific adenine glycosylase|tara:strand:- start:3927 stop:4823 length:897 start_codon:yes stop_codon:yes gene_type:complete
MCQQTQIDTVLPYFERWMASFPSFSTLAAAPEETVLNHWAGLGYYARARNLHKLAKAIAALDELPTTAKEWIKLPGIGPYTASAICSIQFGENVAVVDGNVIRVLSRLYGLETLFPNAQSAAKAVQPLADTFLNRAKPGDHNQAMMELGALVCTKHKPACLLCPAKRHCRALQKGIASDVPCIARKSTVKRTVHRIWAVRDGAIALAKQPAGSRRLAHLHELPLWSETEGPKGAQLIARKKRGISNQIIEEHIWEFDHEATALDQTEGEITWQQINKLTEIPLSGPHQRWINELLEVV